MAIWQHVAGKVAWLPEAEAQLLLICCVKTACQIFSPTLVINKKLHFHHVYRTEICLLIV